MRVPSLSISIVIFVVCFLFFELVARYLNSATLVPNCSESSRRVALTIAFQSDAIVFGSIFHFSADTFLKKIKIKTRQ